MWKNTRQLLSYGLHHQAGCFWVLTERWRLALVPCVVDLGSCRKQFMRRRSLPKSLMIRTWNCGPPGITPLRSSSNSKPCRNLNSYFAFLWGPPFALWTPDLHHLGWSPVARVLLSQRHPGSRKHSFYCWSSWLWRWNMGGELSMGMGKMEESMVLISVCSFPLLFGSIFFLALSGLDLTWIWLEWLTWLKRTRAPFYAAFRERSLYRNDAPSGLVVEWNVVRLVMGWCYLVAV